MHAYYAFASYYMTRRSFIRSFSRLSQEKKKKKDASYPRTGVKGCSKIRRVLAKPRLIVDEMCRLYGKFAKFASYFETRPM